VSASLQCHPALPLFAHRHPWRLVFTKCKNSVQDGRRLENLSWRLWHREMSASASSPNQPPPSSLTEMVSPSETDLPLLVSPIPSPVLGATVSPIPKGTVLSHPAMALISLPADAHRPGVPSPIIHPLASMPSLDTIASPRPRSSLAAGKIICDILPEKISLPRRQPPPHDGLTCIVDIASPSLVPSTTVPALLAPPPAIVTPTTGVPSFPRVVIVNPTPHPTPPATPLSTHQSHHIPLNPISHLPSHLTPSRLPASPARTSGLVSAPPEYVTPNGRLNAVTTLPVPHRLQVLPPQLAIPPQYAPRPPTSQLTPRPPGTVGSTRLTTATTAKHVTVPEFPTAGSALSHQSRFFFRESPEQIDSSPDRAGSALGRAGNDDRPNSRDVSSEVKASLPENVQRTTSERSDSLDADVSVHPGKALTATSSSVGSKGSKDSTSLPRNRKGSTTMPAAAITTTAGATTTRRKPGHQVAGRPARPLVARMNSRLAPQKHAKSTLNVLTTANPAMTKTDPKDKAKGPPSPVTPIRPTLTPTNATVTTKQQGPPPPVLKRRGNSTTSREKRLSIDRAVDLQHPSKTSPAEREPPIAQSQRRGIVAEDDDSSSNSDFETEDTDADSEWASEEISQVEDEKPPTKTNGKTTGKGKGKGGDETTRRARGVAEEEERKRHDREMFAKLPRKSYTNLPEGVSGVGGVGRLYGPPRTRSGLLTQLLNPDPSIFPVNHPYRASLSSQDVTAYSRMNPALSMSRVQAAMPQATRAQVTVNNRPTTQLNGDAAGPSDLRAGGKYRPRGRPDGAEMDDSDGEDDDNKLEVSTSLAQQRLAALVGPRRRGFPRRQNSDPQPQTNLSPAVVNHQVVDHPNMVNPNAAPIPLHHPYNLPPPSAPSTPRTTRRHMLSTELSESLRRNLLWERQVSKVGGQPYQRRPVSALTPGLRPLTSVNEGQASGSGSADTDKPKSDSKEERRKKALDRNRSWADEYHYSGW
jgi:hypothetical protein